MRLTSLEYKHVGDGRMWLSGGVGEKERRENSASRVEEDSKGCLLYD
jgi:hypothetical protein